MSDRGVPLGQLVRSLPEATLSGPASGPVASLAIDSRAVLPGALFVALRGEHTDGHRFIEDAIARGASVIVAERSVSVPENVSLVRVADSAVALSKIADAFYRSPSQNLTVAGVTGTNGKTTVTQMIAAIVNAAGCSAGVIGTIGASFDDIRRPLSNTTPLASELHALLAQMRDRGVQTVAMEVSSHALALGRVADVHFAVGALTNVTRDHLDFHKTPQAYAAAKRVLFTLSERNIFNADDEHGRLWAGQFRDQHAVLTYGLQRQADLVATNIELHSAGSTFRLDNLKFEIRIPGRFNVSNALCAIAVARMLGISNEAAARGLAGLDKVRGRMERISGGGIDVIVDYAHTPDALENALLAVSEIADGRTILVFGCGGDRDRGKRPQMGEVAARYADFTYVTSDNPRSEDPQAIIDEIVSGIGSAPHQSEPDRRAAILAAVQRAQRGDVVLIAGKGHEAYQISGGDIHDFDDAQEARGALRAREHVGA